MHWFHTSVCSSRRIKHSTLIFDIFSIGVVVTGYREAMLAKFIQPVQPETFAAFELVSCPALLCPVISSPAISCPDVLQFHAMRIGPPISCPAILCPANLSVNFTSVIFTSSIFSAPKMIHGEQYA